MAQPSVARQRLAKKQPRPLAFAAPSAGAPLCSVGSAAMVDEAWAEVRALDENAQRKHVHYTHVRTDNVEDVQPAAFTRQAFWQHLEKVYRDVYPEAANPSGSILLFGAVAKEFHKPTDDGTCDEHHHAPTYCSTRHYWKKIAKQSYDVYKVKLNAVSHDGYYSMYSYITQPSSKKPLSELDPEVFLSEHHPRGLALKKLLEVGASTMRATTCRKSRKPSDGRAAEPDAKRFRAGQVFDLVTSNHVQSVAQLQLLAHRSAAAGDSRLAQFCTATGEDKLEQIVRSALSVAQAPGILALQQASRVDLMLQAARAHDCVCKGAWGFGALKVLGNNHEDVKEFARDVLRALDVGACRGTNMAIIGEPGCGKSMLFEPFDRIFKVMGKPEAKSSFPLAGAVGAHVLLWQDYKHKDTTVQFEDLLSLVVGERIDVRIPHQKNVSFRNGSPLFYTSNSLLHVKREDVAEAIRLNAAMDERFRVRLWRNPLPMSERVPNFPRCSRCCANFFLHHSR